MIDLHSHLLPAIDDGARTVEQSVSVLKTFASVGVTDVVLTPHVSAWEIRTDPDDPLERRDAALQTLRDAVAGLEVPTLHTGFEILLDSELPPTAVERGFSLAGSRYVLVEFKLRVQARTAENLLRDVVEQGAVPLVAHPERYQACSVETIRAWREVGARFQVDATTLTRASGRGHRARSLLGAGFADVIAGDNHGDTRSIRTGRDYLAERGGEAQAERLAADNPRAVIGDGDLQPVLPLLLKESFMDMLKRKVKG